MKKFQDVFFGYADANKEAKHNPIDFEKAFFDPSNHLEELTYVYRYIIKGRKGDGKTAYSAKINLLSNSKDSNIKSIQRSLSNFDNGIFDKLKTYDNLGGNPYISFWKSILIIECIKMIDHYEPHNSNPEYVHLVADLQRHGLLEKDDDICITISKLVESNTTIDIKSFISHARKNEHNNTLRGAEQIYTTMYKILKNLYFRDSRFCLIVDGLDDILHHSKFEPKVITGLIRASDEINGLFSKTTLKLKILILIRNDILNVCRDPNFSKIIRDSAINLAWEINDDFDSSNLIQLVKKRFKVAWGTDESFIEIWNNLFIEKVNDKPSFDYVLENMMYRPRDILQFFIEAQKAYRTGQKITQDELFQILSKYSEEYFVDAMRDELTGFFPDGVVTILPDIFMKLGTRNFYAKDFESECKKYSEFKDVEIRLLLGKLFDVGYIGQFRPREPKAYVVFSYRNPRERFNEEHECIIHRGLLRAFTM